MEFLDQLKMKEVGPRVTPAQLDAFEKQLGKKLPPDYRAFLLKYNGGVPKDEVIYFPGTTDATLIQWLWSVDSGGSLEWTPGEDYPPGFFPSGYLPIGTDIGGNFLLLCLKPKNYGQIEWRNCDLGFAHEPLRLLATSFLDLISRLRESTDPELDALPDPLYILGRDGTEKDLDAHLAKLAKQGQRFYPGDSHTLAGLAIRNGNLPLLQVMMRRRMRMSHMLHAAADSNQREIVDFLLAQPGCDINEKNGDGWTPWVYTRKWPELRAYLESRGARP